jgi:hypothetical protein
LIAATDKLDWRGEKEIRRKSTSNCCTFIAVRRSAARELWVGVAKSVPPSPASPMVEILRDSYGDQRCCSSDMIISIMVKCKEELQHVGIGSKARSSKFIRREQSTMAVV